jgi:arylsulfatase A-like enzyme
MYSPDEFSVDLPYAAHKNPTPPMEDVTRLWEAGEAGSIPTFAFRASDEHVKEAKALTAGMITMIDDQVGRLLQSLKDSGQYENTVIVFTSDHGDYLGDFNMMLKGPLKLGSITRVPMIWSDPSSRTAVRTDTMGSTIDLSASILDRAGLAPYNGMQGRSFLESLSGNKPHRDEVLIEFNNQGPRMGMTTVPRVRTLRSKTWRLSVYAGEDWGELYNLQKDPNETHNLWDEPNAREAKLAMSLRLVEHLAQQTDSSPKSNRLA